MIKRPLLWFISFTLVIASFCCLRFILTPLVTNPAGFRYVLQPGTSVKVFVNDLAQNNILTNPILFKTLIYLHGDARKLKAGEYHFPKGTRPLQMIEQMAEGRGMIYHSITIIPGWNFHQVREAISQESYLHHSIQAIKDNELMMRLGNANMNPEGQFFPDTYYFIEGSSDFAVLKRAYAEMQERLAKVWLSRDEHLPFNTSYEALIAASLIEKEAYLNIERPIIAGVLINRLKKNMILQFDPSVIYGMGSQYNGKIKKSDLTKNTPYNTYVHKGLPPTPIAMPSMESIVAALHPEQHAYLYFVARGDGSHQFSTSLVEHNHAVVAARNAEAKKVKEWFNNNLVVDYLRNRMVQ